MIDFIKNINFHSPWFFLLLPLVLYAYYYVSRRTKERELTFGISSNKGLSGIRNWRTRLIQLPSLLNLLSMCLLIIGLARPRLNLNEESVKAEGIDIILSLDLSSSMLSKDFNPNRLEVAKRVANEFIDKRKFDRIGLVVFSGESFTQCPATTDHTILKDFVLQQQVGLLEDGTAIGMGLATAVNRLKDSQAKSKVVILLTDGVNNAGYIDPVTASDMAVQVGVKVYAIGVGSDGVAMSPVTKSMNGEYIFGPQQVNIDEQLLNEIATKTNGKYFRAKDVASLEKIYSVIDQLEKTEIETNVFKRYSEEYGLFVKWALFLSFLSLLLKHTVLRIFP